MGVSYSRVVPLKTNKTRQQALDEAFGLNQPDWDTIETKYKELVKWGSDLQRSTNREMTRDQVRLMLEANPQLMQQQYDLLEAMYPNQAKIGETLAADALSRINLSSGEAYPVPEAMVNLIRKARLEADNARGLPISGVGSAKEAESIVQLGADLRGRDIDTLLTLMGKLPQADTQSVSYQQPSTPQVLNAAASAFNNLLDEEYDRSQYKLGYLLYKNPNTQSSAMDGLLGSTLGSFGGTFGSGLAGQIFGSKLF